MECPEICGQFNLTTTRRGKAKSRGKRRGKRKRHAGISQLRSKVMPRLSTNSVSCMSWGTVCHKTMSWRSCGHTSQPPSPMTPSAVVSCAIATRSGVSFRPSNCNEHRTWRNAVLIPDTSAATEPSRRLLTFPHQCPVLRPPPAQAHLQGRPSGQIVPIGPWHWQSGQCRQAPQQRCRE